MRAALARHDEAQIFANCVCSNLSRPELANCLHAAREAVWPAARTFEPSRRRNELAGPLQTRRAGRPTVPIVAPYLRRNMLARPLAGAVKRFSQARPRVAT